MQFAVGMKTMIGPAPLQPALLSPLSRESRPDKVPLRRWTGRSFLLHAEGREGIWIESLCALAVDEYVGRCPVGLPWGLPRGGC